MERERADFRKNSSGSELFIRLSSSSSMKLSKSILSPGHRNKASPFFPKKRLDNPEPSSPKVTCIGQVRVKTKKKKKKKKKANRSLSSRRSEVSFRKIETPQRSQGWVHLPVSICDALRTCFSAEGKRREIELLVGGGDEEESRISVRRRHVLEDIVVEEETARLSICIPPKNALLLMRCRSDPMKMAALTNRFQIQQIKEEELEITEEMVEDKVEIDVEEEKEESNFVDQENAEQLEDCCPIQVEESNPLAPSIEQDQHVELNDSILLNNEEKDEESSIILIESILINNEDEDEEKEQESSITLKESILLDKEQQNEVFLVLKDEEELEEESRILQNNQDEEDKDDEQELVISEDEEQESILINKQQNEEELVKSPSLPECLLLMMREPKLSMEVSRETWVCSTDFRWRPKPRCDQKRLSFDSKAKRIQPPRSSCSLASMIQKKLANEPLVLTRCNSEPVRVAAAKLLPPDSCFWKKLEPRAAGVGV